MTKLLGNGEGHTVLILTQEECQVIRATLFGCPNQAPAKAFSRGILRGTDRIKAEFNDDQKRRKHEKR